MTLRLKKVSDQASQIQPHAGANYLLQKILIRNKFLIGKTDKSGRKQMSGFPDQSTIPFPAQIHILEISKWAIHDHRIEI